MSRKTAITIIVSAIVIIIAAFAIWYFFFMVGEEPTGGAFPSTGTTTPFTPTKKPPSGVGTRATTTPALFKPILRQITKEPAAGGVIFERAGKQIVRYLERAKGNAYETEADSIKPKRLTNKIIPKVYEAVWKNDGSALIARYANEETEKIESFYGKIKIKNEGTGEGEIQGSFLASNIKELSVSPSTDRIFYLTESLGGALGAISSFDGAKKSLVFDSLLNKWLTNWPRESLITVTTKPVSNALGSLYFVESATGAKSAVLSDIRGLTTLTNADGSKVLYSQSDDTGFMLKMHDVKSKTSSFFPFNTLPEKCVWSVIKVNDVYCAVPQSIANGKYPEDWYQGVTLFTDEIWKIDTKTGLTEFIMNLNDNSGQKIDGAKISLNKKENFLLFTNKQDLNLWNLQIAP